MRTYVRLESKKRFLFRGSYNHLFITVLGARVARWFIFNPKIQIWVNFGGCWNGKCWNIMYMAIWNILRTFGIFYVWPFGTFCVDLVHFFRFWYHAPWIIWQPCKEHRFRIAMKKPRDRCYDFKTILAEKIVKKLRRFTASHICTYIVQKCIIKLVYKKLDETWRKSRKNNDPNIDPGARSPTSGPTDGRKNLSSVYNWPCCQRLTLTRMSRLMRGGPSLPDCSSRGSMLWFHKCFCNKRVAASRSIYTIGNILAKKCGTQFENVVRRDTKK
jgi:hypothetical protein